MTSEQATVFTTEALEEQHVEACSALEARAFNVLRQQWEQPEQPPRRRDWLAYQSQHQPDLAFVTLAGDRVIGFSMGHVWGSLGWLGPIAVDPAWQGHGIGQVLTDKALNAIRAKGCRTISLETWAHSTHNIAFYLKSGFSPGPLTLVFEKPTPQVEAPFDGWRLSEVTELELIIRALADLSGAVVAGLDYGPMIRATLDLRLGDVYLWGDTQAPSAMAVIHTESHMESPPPAYASAELIVIRPGREAVLPGLLAQMEGLARSLSKDRLRVSLSAIHRPGIERLIERKYRLIKTRLRMYGEQQPVPPERVNYLSYVV
jgi:ribosomal protein S18 acetylase RimI-like enzyme